jgi:hypothetical protein
MPYAPVKTTTVETMIRSYTELKGDIAELEKKKGDKKKIADLKKELDEKGKKIEKKLSDDIKAIHASGKKHFQNVDQWLGQAEGFLKTAKESAATFEKTKDHSLVMVVEGGPATIRHLLDEAKSDADDFGKSWFEYRTYNPTSAIKGQALDDKYVKPFAKERMDLMGESKGYVAKVGKIENLIGEAQSLVKLVKSLDQRELHDIEDDRKDAKQVAAAIAKIKTEADISKGKAESNAKGIAGAASQTSCTKEMFQTCQSFMKNMISLDKGVRNDLLSAQKILDTTKKALADHLKDSVIAKELNEAERDLAAVQKDSDEIRKIIAASTKDLAAAQKKVK